MKAVESNQAKQQEKPDHHFGFRFRSRKMSSQETINILGKHTRWDPATPDKLSFFIFAFSDPLQLAEALPAHCFVEIPGTTALLRLTRRRLGTGSSACRFPSATTTPALLL